MYPATKVRIGHIIVGLVILAICTWLGLDPPDFGTENQADLSTNEAECTPGEEKCKEYSAALVCGEDSKWKVKQECRKGTACEIDSWGDGTKYAGCFTALDALPEPMDDQGLPSKDDKGLENTERQLLEKLDSSQVAGDKYESAKTSAELGEYYEDRGRFDLAGHYLLKAAHLFSDIKKFDEAVATYGNLATLAHTMGHDKLAQDLYLTIFDLAKKRSDKEFMADSLIGMGNIDLQSREVDRAMERFTTALRLFEEIGSETGKASALGNMGNAYILKGDLSQAEKVIKRSLEIEKKSKRKKSLSASLSNLGLIAMLRSQHDESEKLYFEALELSKSAQDKAGIAHVTMRIGDLHAKRGQKSKAKNYYLEALKLYYEIGMKKGVEDVRNALEKHGLGNATEGSKK